MRPKSETSRTSGTSDVDAPQSDDACPILGNAVSSPGYETYSCLPREDAPGSWVFLHEEGLDKLASGELAGAVYFTAPQRTVTGGYQYSNDLDRFVLRPIAAIAAHCLGVQATLAGIFCPASCPWSLEAK